MFVPSNLWNISKNNSQNICQNKKTLKNWGLEEAESGEDKIIQKWNRQSFQSPHWSTGRSPDTSRAVYIIMIWDRATNNTRMLGGQYRWQDTVCMRYSFSKAHGSSLFLSAKQGSFYLAHSPLLHTNRSETWAWKQEQRNKIFCA